MAGIMKCNCEYFSVLFLFIFVRDSVCVGVSNYKIIDLSSTADGVWTVSNNLWSINVGAVVPGGIYSDLISNGLISNIFVGDNDVQTRWVARENWTYTAIFYVKAEQFSSKLARLVFQGVDTFAEVKLNGEVLGRTNNMFQEYSFNVRDILKTGQNLIVMTFTSPLQVADDRSAHHITLPLCVPDVYHGECHVNQIRKMQASFSWDWGPAFPSIGIWKPVYIEFFDSAKISQVLTNITTSGHMWTVELTAVLETSNFMPRKIIGSLEVKMGTDSGEEIFVVQAVNSTSDSEGLAMAKIRFYVSLSQVSVWWPSGYGEQHLYRIHVVFKDEQGDISEKKVSIGFRTIELIEEDASLHLGRSIGARGLTFYFKVNGYPLFMKGSNWIPGHILPEKGTNKNIVDDLLESAAYVGMNMLRVWGGGFYESDYFYERCDQLGILIWQDFMFACSMYPVDSDFLTSVSKEIKQNVMRLQHHVSIALWAGNNENEAALRGNWYDTGSNFAKYKDDYIKLYVETIKPIVQEADPTRRYLVSSPSNGLESELEGYVAMNPYDPHYGDTHYYNYLSNGWNMNIYPKTRFASEYGFQSFPSMETLTQATNMTVDFSTDSDFMVHRQHSPGGTAFVKAQVNTHFSLKENDKDYFWKFVFYSQVSQAMAVKAETEYYRQSRFDWMTMGALYWQLNDVWQAPSWSGIEFGGKWKVLHYMAKNFFAPILVSPRLTNYNEIEVYVINDKLVPLEFVVIMETYSWNSFTPIKEQKVIGYVGALSVAKIKETWPADKKNFYKFQLKHDTLTISPENFLFPDTLKKVVIKEPNVKIVVTYKERIGEVSTFTINVYTDVVTPFLYLEAYGVPGHFSDNAIIATKRNTKLRFYTPLNLTKEQFRETIRWQSYWRTNEEYDEDDN